MPPHSHGSGGPIRAAYRRAGMNRSQFQRAIGVAYSTILNWERGRTRPNADHLEVISKVTGVPAHELLGGERVTIGAAPRYPALDDFMSTTAGRSMSPNERRTVENIVFHELVPTVATYHAILVGLRMADVGPRKPPRRGRARAG